MLKVGQRWKRRDGKEVRVAKRDTQVHDRGFQFWSDDSELYRIDGTWCLNASREHEYDLVELIADVPTESDSDASPLTKQHGGDHYRKLKIQPIQYIEANGLGFHEGNVLKYITRWKDKNGVEDLRKAVHYLELLIEHVQREKNDE